MRPVNLARLSPLRRGFVLGFLRAKRQARRELARQAADFDAELVALQDEFHELAIAHHRQCHDAAVSEAILQRAMDPDALLH
jgi:hypothetical protein